MCKQVAKGVWPTMVTPFNKDWTIDYEGLEELVEWYLTNNVDGLFAVCQSSEMFFLEREERNELARAVVKFAKGRCSVVASGHVSDTPEEQIKDIIEMGSTGVDAVVLVSNRLIKEGEDESKWFENLESLLNAIPPEINLGMYECPYPFRHYLSDEMVEYLSSTQRFLFLKDTSSDLKILKKRAELVKNGNLRLYNANSATLLESLRFGYSGFSGVMANFHPQLYHWLYKNRERKEDLVQNLQDFLGLSSMIEMYGYPRVAKYFLKGENLAIEETTRGNGNLGLENSVKELAKQLKRQSLYWERICK
ncbi:MAG: dihydrodipicolinate synthase family protein [Sphaerochaetaceae bacterium]